jgi:hypothetical protein
MNTRSTDIMSRLSAADPARHVVLDGAERDRAWQLLAAASGDSCARRRAPHSRLQRLRLAVPALLILAAVALAATGVIRAAEPVNGSSAPLRGEDLAKGPVRFLPLTSPDPGGSPPWGMRMLSTKAGEGCVQVAQSTCTAAGDLELGAGSG